VFVDVFTLLCWAANMKTISFILILSSILQLISCEKILYDYVTCGSVLKLLNVASGVRLHSHDVKYGSGSGQQSVTAVTSSEDHNSYWRVQGKMGLDCERGQPIKCGQTIRLTHVATGKNLHSHHFKSPLSHNLEVSAFGESGIGDEGDHWAVTCSGKHWKRSESVRIKHLVTENYLHVTGDSYGRPIQGQREVSGYHSPSELNYWKAAEGIFVKPSEPLQKVNSPRDEL